VPLSLEDRAQLADLLTDYAFAIDLRRWDELRDVFTEDAVINYVGTPEHAGIEEILAFFRASAGSVAATQHLIHTSRVWSTGTDRAAGLTHVTAHHTAYHVTPPVPPESTYTVTGTYTDEFRRDRRGWRIAHRRLTLLTRSGDPAILVVH